MHVWATLHEIMGFHRAIAHCSTAFDFHVGRGLARLDSLVESGHSEPVVRFITDLL